MQSKAQLEVEVMPLLNVAVSPAAVATAMEAAVTTDPMTAVTPSRHSCPTDEGRSRRSRCKQCK